MCMLDEIRAKREEIYAIARAHKAEKLWVFGSCARKEDYETLTWLDGELDVAPEFVYENSVVCQWTDIDDFYVNSNLKGNRK